MDIIIIFVILLFVCCCIIIVGGVGYYSIKNVEPDNTQSTQPSGSNTSVPSLGSNKSVPSSGSNKSVPVSGSNKSVPTSSVIKTTPRITTPRITTSTTTPAPTTTEKPLKECPSDTNDSGTTCWYDRGVGTVPGCPTGTVQKAIECYDKPPEGYDWTTPGGLLIGKICPSGTNDSLTTCWYDRGVGTIPTCPAGQVQKAIECYDNPPSGYDWTTPGGLLIGKICPSGSNDSGTTCWYDRGVGRIPDIRPCASGLRDDGTSCWKDSYGRGAGRIPDKAGCPNGWRDDGTSCWEDLSCNTWDDGFYNTSWGRWGCDGPCNDKTYLWGGYTGCNDCYRTWIPVLKTSCSGCGCIKQNLFDRQTCNGNEEKNGALCYPKCDAGYYPAGCCICEPDGGPGIKTTLFDRQYCQPDEDLIAGLCYKKPRDGFSCTATHCQFSKDVKWGNKTGLIASCSDDRQLEAGMCYIKPKDGYDCAVTHCQFSKDVKPGNKTGLIDSCPDDRQLEAGMCYTKPRDGYDCAVTHCQYSKDVKPGNKTGLIDSCPDDRQLEAGMCYTKPQDGFECTLTHCKFNK